MNFRANDGHYYEYGRSDADGNFVMQILAARAGVVTGEISVGRDDAGECPQLGAKFNPNGLIASLQSVAYAVAGDVSISGMEIVFPFPSCDAWLKHAAELHREIKQIVGDSSKGATGKAKSH